MAILILVEPLLKHHRGHRLPDTIAIVETARARGLDVRVLAHRNVEEQVQLALADLGVQVEPVFDLHLALPLHSAILRRLISSVSFASSLARIISDVKQPSIVLIEGWDDFMAGAVVASLLAPKQMKFVFQLFGWSGWVEKFGDKATRQMLEAIRAVTLRLARWATRRGRFFLAGQTEHVAEELGSVLGEKVIHLPLPIQWETYGPISGTSSEPPRLGFLGDTRPEKGFDLFVQAVACLQRDYRLEAQATPDGHQPKSDTRLELIRQLARNPHHTIHQHFLPQNEYVDLMSRLDIVVLPYRAARYMNRSSQIFVEAVGMGKVVVTNGQTQLGKMTEQYEIGTTFSEETPAALTEALHDALGDHERLRKRCRQLAESWRATHCVEHMLDELLNTFGQVSGDEPDTLT
jgi:glycosyltransferase involved in cell wall biosynthesis